MTDLPYQPKNWQDAAGGAPNPAEPSAFYQRMNDLENAVAALSGGSYQAKTWTVPTSGTAITAARLNDLEQVAAMATATLAPPPSGGNDTAVLTALVNAAAKTGGTVQLREGTYYANLDIVSQFMQPLIVGRGRYQTTIKAFLASKPVVKFNGGSGSIAGGGLRSLTLAAGDGGGGDALVFSGCGGVAADDIRIDGAFDYGVVFWNERGSDFTEFDTFQGSIYSTKTPVQYRVSNGIESFHGSGLVGNTVIGMPSGTSGPVIKIDSPGLPYNAPMSCTVFLSSSSQWLIQNNNTAAGRHATFHGSIRLENNGGASGQALGRGINRILFLGRISWLGSGTNLLGNIFLSEKVTYEGSSVVAELRPVTVRGALKNSPTQFGSGLLDGGQSALIAVTIFGGNYHKAFLLVVMHGPYDGTGTVTQLARTYNIDNAGIGDPSFAWTGSGLYISNPNFTSAQTAFLTVTPLGGAIQEALLAQFVAS